MSRGKIRIRFQELNAGGRAVVIGAAVVAIAVIVWAFTARWPTVLLFVIFAVVALLVPRHRRVLAGVSAAWFVMIPVVTAVNPHPEASGPRPQPTAPTTDQPPGPPKVVYELTPVAGSATRQKWIGPDPEYGRNPIQAPVIRVIDGDTFEIPGGVRVRALGIDSCEMSTPGGQKAKDGAEWTLGGSTVLLTSEPGVTLDRYGRQLRYVTKNGTGDFGEHMVRYGHTGIFQGTHNASPAYVAELTAADSDGRDCSEPPQAPPVDTDNAYVPVPGDGNDGDEGEGRFCSKRRWC